MFRRSGLILLLAMICMNWPASAQPSADAPGQILGGDPNAPIRIEVFSDFQCSACREFYLNTIRQVLPEYAGKNKVCVIYHEFPLAMHKYSRDAARYAEAAARLGVQRLLPVMDSIFMDQAIWSQDGKLEASVSKALPHEDFLKLKKIMLDPSINEAVEREYQLGMKSEIKSTPTMFVSYSGKRQKVEGMITYLVLKQFIDKIIK